MDRGQERVRHEQQDRSNVLLRSSSSIANLSTRTTPEVVQARYTLPCVWPRKFSSSRNWLADTERGAKCSEKGFRRPLLYWGLGSVHQTNVESVTCKQT